MKALKWDVRSKKPVYTTSLLNATNTVVNSARNRNARAEPNNVQNARTAESYAACTVPACVRLGLTDVKAVAGQPAGAPSDSSESCSGKPCRP